MQEGAWDPAEIMFVRKAAIATSTAPLVVRTDAGNGYAKVMGNPEGPSALACEMLGTLCARWLGLRTFEFAVLTLPQELVCDLGKGCRAIPGPAFVTQESLGGREWSGSAWDLSMLEDHHRVAGLVVVDTWLRNPDRYFPRTPPRRNCGNVFFAANEYRRGSYRLVAMDFTACLRQDGELTMKSLAIVNEKQEAVFGLFPEFEALVKRDSVRAAAYRLLQATEAEMMTLVKEIPKPWLPDGDVRASLPGFLSRRAKFVADRVEQWLEALCKWQGVLPYEASHD